MARKRATDVAEGIDPSKIAAEREIFEELRADVDREKEFDAAEMLDMTDDEVEEFFDGGCTDE